MAQRVLWVAILASFVAFLDGAIVTVALPAMSRDLGGGLTTQQWVVDSYLLTLGALILLAGSLSDIFGRGRVLWWGLLVFGAASVACALAPSALFLIIARAVQGAGAALLVPSSLAIITSTFNEPQRGKAIGSWTAWTGTAFLIGPLLGGLLVDYSSWRFIFGINVIPIALTLWLLRGIEFPQAKSDAGAPSQRIDGVGAILASLGLAGTVFALIEQGRWGWGNPVVYLSFGLGLLCLVAFLWWEHRNRAPMVPLGLFRIRNFGMGNLATAFIYAGASLGQLVVVLYLQEVAGLSASTAGLASIPSAVIMLLLAGKFGELSGRFGPRIFMALGPVVAGIGYLLMMTTSHPFNFWLQILPGTVLLSLGMSITVAPLTAAILGAVPVAQSGIGSAINNAVSRIAGLIAVASLGAMVGGQLDDVSFRRVVAITAGLYILGGVISALGIRNSRHAESSSAQISSPSSS